jgi:hypothetical protein
MVVCMNFRLRHRRSGPILRAVLLGAAILVTGCTSISESPLGQGDQEQLNSRVHEFHHAWDRFVAESVPCPEDRLDVFAACFEAGYQSSGVEPAAAELSQLLGHTSSDLDGGACRTALETFRDKLEQFRGRLVGFEQDVSAQRARDVIIADAVATRARLDESIRLQNASVRAC